ncbi:unnamed protein product [Dibothriocephalus latus]|uniref:Uncharacterized protein n=1 Tax=Dibothriocephalus latus TaxID=60516 RepID=A0A3P7LP77_DIBLA|nr:unnamed protein product [Dibothriocephalus latus]
MTRMPPKKTKLTRSRSSSRSRARPASKKRSPSRRSVSRSSRSRTPASESKVVRRRSPSLSDDEQVVKSSKQQRRGTRASSAGRIVKSSSRSSVRLIEKLEALHPSEARTDSPKSRYADAKPTSFGRRLAVSVGCLMHTVYHGIFSEATGCVLATLLLPLMVLYLNFLVLAPTSSESGTHLETPWGPGMSLLGSLWPSDVHAYFDPYAAVLVLGFLMFTMIVSRFMPFGRSFTVIAGGRRTDARVNGLIVALLCATIMGLIQWKGDHYVHGFQPANLHNHWPGLLTTSVILSITTGMFAFWHAGGHQRKAIVKSFHGIETRPRVFGSDFKLLLLYPSMIGLRILEVTLALRQYNEHGRVSPALFTVIALHGLYIFDFFVFEPTILSSFKMNHEGFGLFQTIRLFVVFPFMSGLNAFFLAVNYDAGHPGTELKSYSTALLIASVSVFLIGLWIKRISSNEKRAVVVERSCATRYVSAWNRYTGLVPKRFLPHPIKDEGKLVIGKYCGDLTPGVDMSEIFAGTGLPPFPGYSLSVSSVRAAVSIGMLVACQDSANSNFCRAGCS